MTAVAQSTSLRLDGNVFKVLNWKPPAPAPAGGWASVLTVYAGSGDVPPLAGTYAVENGLLVFRATYPIASGVRYRVVFHPPAGATIETFFDGPARSNTPSAR